MTQVSDFKKKAAVYGLLTLLTAALVFWLSAKCPYLSDDWHFFFVWDAFDPTEKTRRVQSFSDILISMQNYYQISGGRVIAHFLVYCLLTVSKTVFNLLNGVMYAAMCWLLYRIAEAASGCKNIWLYPLTVLLSFLFLPMFGDDALWLSGSVNYLWMSVPFLGCINWLLRRFDQAAVWERLFILPLFLLSASTNEITGGMLAVASVLCFLLLSRRSVLSLIGCLVSVIPGICLVVLAPGNAFRRSVVEHISPDAAMMYTAFVQYLKYLLVHEELLLLIIVLCFFLRFYDQSLSWKERFRPFILFLVGAAGTTALAYTGFFITRPLFFTCLLLIPSVLCAVAGIFRQLQNAQNKIGFLLVRCISILLLEKGILFLVYEKILILGIVCLVIAVILPRIKLTITEKDVQQLKELTEKLYKIQKYVLPVCCLLFCGWFGVQLADYFRWTREYAQFEQHQTAMIRNDQLKQAVEDQSVPFPTCNLIPLESRNVSSWYRVEWIAQYYGRDSRPVVEEFSKTYPLYIAYLEANNI